VPIVALQAALMFDVPVRLAGPAATGGWASAAIEHFDRVMLLAVLGYVCFLWCRPTSTVRAT
jgi:hypothetical protein